MISFGEKLRELRRKRGISQGKLAVKTNLSVAHIQSLEIGRRANPRTNTIVALAKALDVPVAELIEETPQPRQLTMEETELMKLLRDLEPESKEDLLDYARLLEKKSRLSREVREKVHR